jgi:hypothetical protein
MRIPHPHKSLQTWTRAAVFGALVAISPLMPITLAHADVDLASAFDNGAQFESVNDSEMAAARGGYRGVSFGVYFSGTVSSTGNTGDLPAGMSITQDGDNHVQLQASLGDLGGASGLFQFTNVVGDMNIVNNSIVINVMVVPDLPSDVASAWR